MTTDRMALGQLLEKGSDTNRLRAMVGFVAQRLMELDVEGASAAPPTASARPSAPTRTPAPGMGMGERPHAGGAELRIPKLREGVYLPVFWRRGARREGARGRDPGEAYVQGVSTCGGDELFKATGVSGISKSQDSRPCEAIDERVNAFLARPIEGGRPYPWIDATWVKVREAGASSPSPP